MQGGTLMSTKLKRLTEQRKALEARIRDEEQKLRADERKLETRRKILMGAWAFEKAARDNDFSALAMAELKAFLVRDSDRELFGLPPLPKVAQPKLVKPEKAAS